MLRLRKLLLSATAKVHSRPTIVLGLEKSGTTAIAALLAKYADLSVTLDIPDLWGDTVVKLSSGQLRFSDFVQNHNVDFSRDIIKEPNMTFIYPQIRQVFSQSNFIMIVRDPRQVIRSILNRLHIKGDLAYLGPEVLRNIPNGWQYVFDSSWLGIDNQFYIEVLCRRWNYAVDTYLAHREEILFVQYEKFTADKTNTIASIAQKLGIPQVNDIAKQVDVQYQPQGNRSIAPLEFFGSANLELIEKVCGERMVQLGYSIKSYQK